MIESDAELEVIRKQLARAENALASLRASMQSANQKMFDLMSGSYVETIQSLRGQIDRYLGVPGIVPEKSVISVSLEGQGVRFGEVSAAAVTRIVDSVRRGLQSLVEIIEPSEREVGGRRRHRWIEQLCDLPLAGISPGSVKVYLGEPNDQSLVAADYKKLLDEAVALLFEGLEWADDEQPREERMGFAKLSVEKRNAVLNVLNGLVPPMSGPIETVAFYTPITTVKGNRTAALGRNSRDIIRSELSRLATERGYQEIVGAIRAVDLDKQSFVLRNRDDGGPDLPCAYSKNFEETVVDGIDKLVWIAGILTTSTKNNQQTMEIEAIDLFNSLGELQDNQLSE